jgi:hypothetical protein
MPLGVEVNLALLTLKLHGDEEEAAGHIACLEKLTNVYRELARKPEAKRPFVRCNYRGEDNIKVDPKGIMGKVWITFLWLKMGMISSLL